MATRLTPEAWARLNKGSREKRFATPDGQGNIIIEVVVRQDDLVAAMNELSIYQEAARDREEQERRDFQRAERQAFLGGGQ